MAEDKPFEKDESGSKKRNGPKPGTKAKPAAAQSGHDPVDELDEPNQTISLFLAVGLIVSALIVGLIVGYVVAPKSAVSDFGATAAPAGSTAPALTPDQINSQQLPPSHPPLPGAGESSASAPGASEGGKSGKTPAP